MSSLYWIIRRLLIIVFKIFFRFEVIGSENVPVEGGVIVATNHVSYLDPLVVGSALKRRATYMARRGLFKIPLIGTFVKSFSFPVDRKKPQPSTIKEAVNRLKKGELMVMFPEGGRSKDGGILNPKRGIGMITSLSGAKVVPAYIGGTDKALPRGARFLKLAKIKVIFAKPLDIKKEATDKDFQERIANDIIKEIRSLKMSVNSDSVSEKNTGTDNRH